MPDESTTTRVVAADAAVADDAARFGTFQLTVLSVGHAVVDSYGHSLLLPVFPIIRDRLDLGLGQIGALPMIMGLASSFGQPLIGLVTDRWPRIPAVVLGPAAAAIFMGLVGFSSSYVALAAILFLTGLGIAAYHPQGASLACAAGRGGGLAMSVFTVGGNIGFGLAPTIGAIYFAWFGLEQFYFASVPGLVFATALFLVLRRGDNRLLLHRSSAADGQPRRGNPAALALLTGTVMSRTAVQIAFSTFLAFLLRERLPESGTNEAGVALSAFWLANAIAGPAGGYLSDLVGRKTVMIGSLAVAPFVLFISLQLPGYWFVAGLSLGAFILAMPHPANVVMATEFMPKSAGMAASMITGVAWGLGQFIAWPLGALAERTSLNFALGTVCWLPLVGIFLVLALPDPRDGHRTSDQTLTDFASSVPKPEASG